MIMKPKAIHSYKRYFSIMIQQRLYLYACYMNYRSQQLQALKNEMAPLQSNTYILCDK